MSANSHLCTSLTNDGGEGWCNTNTYKNTMVYTTLYDWDKL